MKATKAQVEARVTELLRIKLDGAEAWDLCEYVRGKEFEQGSLWYVAEGAKPLSESQIRRYAQKADKLLTARHGASRARLRRRHLAQRRNLYAKAVSQGDIKAALACIKDEAELQGLYPPKKIAPTSPDGSEPYVPDPLSADEQDALVRAVLARVGVVCPLPDHQGPTKANGQIPHRPGVGDEGGRA